MFKKISLVAAAGVGYVLGSRAGRERYEQIKAGAERVASNPTVQNAASKAGDAITTRAPIVGEIASKVRNKSGRHVGNVDEAKFSDDV